MESRAHAQPTQADVPIEVTVCSDGGLLCYRRGEHTYVAVNPTDSEQISHMKMGKKLFETGRAEVNYGTVVFAPQTAVIFEL